ncbi:MAG TPA: O-antigen ligase family protein, partial [Planctomycetota bacterium]|nr:O-antigen ligase family protein [Planctomycetota bacterium]
MSNSPGGDTSDGRAIRLLDGVALGLFAAHAALRLSLRGGDGAWGSNLFTHLLVPLAAAVWLTARALERRFSWRSTGFEIPLAALAAVTLITTLGASNRLAAMDGTAGLCAAVLSVPLAVHLFGSQGRTALLGLLVALVAVVALYGCVQYIQLGELQSERMTSQAIESAEDSGEFAGRVKAQEPWSTLHYPNTFAGFLILALPFVLGAALDSKSKIAGIAGFMIVAGGAFGLWSSGSSGAFVAAGAAAAAFGILELLRRHPEWKRRLYFAAVPLVAMGIVFVAAGPLSPNALAKKSEAMAIRDVYWDSAIEVAKAHPFGVGLYNFEDHYYEHKDDRQEEVRHVHNDYLQVLAELGIPGLLAFLAIIAVAVATALRPATVDPADPVDASRLPLSVGLGLGWLAAFGFQGAFGDIGIAAILAGAGIGAFWIFTRPGGFGHFTRIGLAAGLAGAAVHFLVDFDFFDPAYRQFFFLALAGLALTSRLEIPGIAPTAVSAISAAVLFLVVLPLAAVVAPRFLEAEESAGNAERAAALGKNEEADALWEAAAVANRLDADPALRRGLREFHLWATAQAEDGHAELALTILEDALRRRPRSAPIEARLAEVQEAVAQRARAKGGPGAGMEAASAEAMQAEAERHARRAIELYPTRAYHRYLLGRILDASGRAAESAN